MQGKRYRRGMGLLILLAAITLSQVAAGQTYRDRATQKAPARLHGLPERVASVPSNNATDRQHGAKTSHPQPANEPRTDSSGQQLVAEASRQVFSLPSLHARVRMKFPSQERQVVATGEYMQLGAGEEKLLRLDLKVPVGSKIGTMQEIRGRDYLWLIRDLPPDGPQLERIWLRKARIEIAKADEAQRMPRLEGWMLLGGLSRLLTTLEMNFDFSPPRRATLADVPVVIIRGRWKQASLARIGGGKLPAELPPQMPQEVELTLGEPGQALPLFPYRIAYQRHSWEEEQGRGGGRRDAPLTTIEFFEVNASAELSPQQFEFDPEDREFDDVTMAYLRKLGLVPPK